MSVPRIFRLSAEAPDPAVLAEAARIVRDGGLVAFPTETVYGLAADATNPDAIDRLNQVKGRPPDKPYSLHLHSVSQVRELVPEIPPQASRLMERFWPGPLTIVIPFNDPCDSPRTFGFVGPWRNREAISPGRSPGQASHVSGRSQTKPRGSLRIVVSPSTHSVRSGSRVRSRDTRGASNHGKQTVGMRVPDHPIARAFLKACDVPVVAPSANRSGALPPTDAQQVLAGLDGAFDCLLDGGPTRCGRESTVVEVVDGRLDVRREGAIPTAAILSVADPERGG